jgi:hypothetical protein
LLKETKHGIQGIAMVKTRFEGVDQSTHDIVGLFSLLGPALGSSSASRTTLNREVFYPLNFLTGEPFGLRVIKIVRIFSDVDVIFPLLPHNEPILARMKSASLYTLFVCQGFSEDLPHHTYIPYKIYRNPHLVGG